MFKSLDQFEILRANEYARISRWVRDSEHGWLFYDHRGRAHSISFDEAIALETTAQRQVERHIRALQKMPMRIIVAVLATFFFYRSASALLPTGLEWAAPATIAPFIVLFAFEASSGLRYRMAQRRWQAAQAERFQFRAAVPAAVEAHHRRYNLFRIASVGFAMATIGHVAWLAIMGGPEPGVTLTTLLLAGLAWLFFLPANRVDATHRRRKWLS